MVRSCVALAVLFDINETTLDLGPLGPRFETVFGEKSVAQVWFPRLLHASAVCALTGVRTTFRDLAGDELRRLAAERGLSLAPEAEAELLGGFATLPAHGDVEPALDRLAAAGVPAYAFSNSSTQLLKTQLSNAGIVERFEGVISVEEVGSFKPSAEVYAHAVSRVGLPADRIFMLAAHDWDVHGAMKAGLRGALLERGSVPGRRAYLKPDLQDTDMVSLAQGIIASG